MPGAAAGGGASSLRQATAHSSLVQPTVPAYSMHRCLVSISPHGHVHHPCSRASSLAWEQLPQGYMSRDLNPQPKATQPTNLRWLSKYHFVKKRRRQEHADDKMQFSQHPQNFVRCRPTCAWCCSWRRCCPGPQQASAYPSDYCLTLGSPHLQVHHCWSQACTRR